MKKFLWEYEIGEEYIGYPILNDTIKCNIEYKSFKSGKEYKIVWIGDYNVKTKEFESFTLLSLRDNGTQFNVWKKTVYDLIEKGYLIRVQC